MYLFFSLFVLTIATGTALYLTRVRWGPALQSFLSTTTLPGGAYLYSALPSSFQGDMEAGLSSSTFDLSGNVANGSDTRAGLDGPAKREILRIMQRRRLKFDEARRVYMEERFAANGIGADGRPRDPKFVSFS